MELDGRLIWIAGSWLLLMGGILYFGYRLIIRKKRTPAAQKVTYDEARRIVRTLLKGRYQGKRGFIKPYVREFGFEHSGESLRKALQETNPTPNLHYVQRVLDDLKPGKYAVLPPESAKESRVA